MRDNELMNSINGFCYLKVKVKKHYMSHCLNEEVYFWLCLLRQILHLNFACMAGEIHAPTFDNCGIIECWALKIENHSGNIYNQLKYVYKTMTALTINNLCVMIYLFNQWYNRICK